MIPFTNIYELIGALVSWTFVTAIVAGLASWAVLYSVEYVIKSWGVVWKVLRFLHYEEDFRSWRRTERHQSTAHQLYDDSITSQDLWDDFWKDLMSTDGEIDMQKIKEELHAYSVLLEQVPEVYFDVTGGMISKPHTHGVHVIGAVERRIQESYDDGGREGDEEWQAALGGETDVNRCPKCLRVDLQPCIHCEKNDDEATE